MALKPYIPNSQSKEYKDFVKAQREGMVYADEPEKVEVASGKPIISRAQLLRNIEAFKKRK